MDDPNEERKLRRRLRKLHSDLVLERDPLRARAIMRQHEATRDRLAELTDRKEPR